MPLDQVRYSIIIPCYNASAFVGRAIESALRQTRNDWEVLLINDGSTDDTAEIIESFSREDNQRVHGLHQENKGPAAARNTGIRSAKGEYILFLDADDCLAPYALELLGQAVSASAHAYHFVYAGHYAVDVTCKMKILSPKPKTVNTYKEFKRFLAGKGVSPTIGAIMIHRDCFQTLSFPESIRSNEDLVLFAHLFALYSGRSIQEPVVYKYKRPGSLRSDKQAITDALHKAPDLLFDPAVLPREYHKLKPLYKAKRYLEKARIHFQCQEYSEFRKAFYQAVRTQTASVFTIKYLLRFLRSIFLQFCVISKKIT